MRKDVRGQPDADRARDDAEQKGNDNARLIHLSEEGEEGCYDERPHDDERKEAHRETENDGRYDIRVGKKGRAKCGDNIRCNHVGSD